MPEGGSRQVGEVVGPGRIVYGVYLSAGQLAHLIGVKPATLRVWEQRYGQIVAMRTEGGHRRYNLATCQALKQAVVVEELRGRAALERAQQIIACSEESPDLPMRMKALEDRMERIEYHLAAVLGALELNRIHIEAHCECVEPHRHDITNFYEVSSNAA